MLYSHALCSVVGEVSKRSLLHSCSESFTICKSREGQFLGHPLFSEPICCVVVLVPMC